jgi:TrpR-related protein YerC/YecD
MAASKNGVKTKKADRGTENSAAALYAAIAGLRDAGEVERFLTDLCTRKELAEFAERWLLARLLDQQQFSYREISAMTGASTTTVGRVARFLDQEPHQGYRLVLNRVTEKKATS